MMNIEYVDNSYYITEEHLEYETIQVRLYRVYAVSIVEKHQINLNDFKKNLRTAIETIIAENIEDEEEKAYYLRAAKYAYAPLVEDEQEEQFYKTLANYILKYDTIYSYDVDILIKAINFANTNYYDYICYDEDYDDIANIIELFNIFVKKYIYIKSNGFLDLHLFIHSSEILCDIICSMLGSNYPANKIIRIDCQPCVFARSIIKHILENYDRIQLNVVENKEKVKIPIK